MKIIRIITLINCIILIGILGYQWELAGMMGWVCVGILTLGKILDEN